MEITKQRLTAIIAGVVAVVIIGIYLLLYRPVIVKLKIEHKKTQAIEAEVAQARKAISILKAKGAEKHLVTEEDISLSIDELTKRGKAEGIDFVSISPMRVEKPADLACLILPIKMEIESTYKDLGTFLGSLERDQKSLITLRGFSIVADKKNPHKVRAKLELNMYCK